MTNEIEKAIRAFEIIKLKLAYEKDVKGAYETAQEAIKELTNGK